MQKKEKLILTGALALSVFLLVLAVYLSFLPKDNVQGAIILTDPTNVIGTRTGTTTTPVQFTSYATASTTYTTRITGMADTAIYTLKVVAASSTPTGGVHLSFFGSNDYDCATATTTTIYNLVTKKDINWFDIGSHVANLAGSQTLASGTSTLVWLPTVGRGIDVTLTDLNYECLSVEVAASSTQLFMQVRTKGEY